MADFSKAAAAVGRIPSGVFILTAKNGNQETGMLASWVQQCSFQPLQVTLLVKQGRVLSDWLTLGSLVTVNVLCEGQHRYLSHFGKGFGPGEPAFGGLNVRIRESLGPVLNDAHAYFDAKIVARVPASDHELLVAEVIAGEILTEGNPMVHIRKSGTHY